MIWNTVKLNRELVDMKASVQTECNARLKAESDLKEAQDVIGNFMTEKEKYEATIKDLTEKLDAATKASAEKIAEVKVEAETKVAEVTKEAEALVIATEASVNAKVNNELANIGVQASSIKISQEVLPTKDEVIKKLKDLQAEGKSNEAQAYYQKYKAVAWAK